MPKKKTAYALVKADFEKMKKLFTKIKKRVMVSRFIYPAEMNSMRLAIERLEKKLKKLKPKSNIAKIASGIKWSKEEE